MWQKCLYFYHKEGSWHRTENLLQAIQLVHMKPGENEHIRTAPYRLSDSWDKGKCLIAAFQTKSTQLRTRVRVKKVLKRNITHSSTVIKEYWNKLQNSLFFQWSKWRKKYPSTFFSSGSFVPGAPPTLMLNISVLIFNLHLLEEAVPLPGFKDCPDGMPRSCMRTLPHTTSCKAICTKMHFQEEKIPNSESFKTSRLM